MSELLEVIEDLQLDKGLNSLSEANIGLGVVLKILDVLGWNTYNYHEVSSEYSVENRSVDYTLLIDNKQQVYIEVRKGGEPLEEHQEQLLDYASRQGVKIAILTNGTTWWFYLPLQEGNWEQRKFDTMELGDQDKEEIAQKLVGFLGKENVSSGNAIQNAEILYKILYKKRQISSILSEAWNQLVSEPEIINLLAKKAGELCGYNPEKKEIEQFLLTHLSNIKITPPPTDRASMKGTKPTAFTFNGTECEVESWKEMLVRLCEIVHNDQGSRFEEVLNLKIAKAGKLPDFSRKEGDFNAATEIKRTGIFVNTNKSADRIIRTAENLIAHFGYAENALCIDAQRTPTQIFRYLASTY